MGPIVSTLAFPNPPRDYSESILRQHPGLVWLRTASGLQIPAVHVTPQSFHSSKSRQPHNTTTDNNNNKDDKQQQQQQRPTILYSHGNAEDLGIILPYLQTMANLTECPVFGYEYPGYSLAEGAHASERLCYEAIQAAHEHLVHVCACNRIVAFGRSLGSGPTVHLCAQQKQKQTTAAATTTTAIMGCMLQSPLTSAIRCVLDSCTAVTLSPIDIFVNQAKVERITCPVFILHGTADAVVPCAHGKALYAALQERGNTNTLDYPPLWIPGRGHNDMPERFCLSQCRAFVDWLLDKRA